MQKYNLDSILDNRYITSIANEEWEFLNSLDFDTIFKERMKPTCFDHTHILGDLVSGFSYTIIHKLVLIKYPSKENTGITTITDKGWDLIKWSILNRFYNTCKVIDYYMQNHPNLEARMQVIINIISLIPSHNYAIMISLSKNPDKLIQLIGKFGDNQ